MNPSGLEAILSYQFKDHRLLEEALTHRSYLNERPDWRTPHNERLEFLGDAVLELVVTEELFHRFPESEEGTMTSLRAALVNYQMLAAIARGMGLEPFLFLSRGEAKDTGRAREVILANAFEAVMGALYLDGGYAAAKKTVNAFVMTMLEDVIRKGLAKDAKSELQERVQAESRVTPAYRILAEQGPDHEKQFTAAVYCDEKELGRGSGLSKQEAELEAAKDALSKLESGGISN